MSGRQIFLVIDALTTFRSTKTGARDPRICGTMFPDSLLTIDNSDEID